MTSEHPRVPAVDVHPLGEPPTGGCLLVAALRYAAAGIPVMPMHTPQPGGCTCRAGARCASSGKHPRTRHGLRDASTDPALLRTWWTRWPRANVGLATGGVLDVCDVDTADALRRLLDVLQVVRPAGPLVRTGLGWHLWLAATGLPNRVGLLPGVDWRGRGGAVVAPPSVHATGHRYLFTQPWTGQPLPHCPPPLRRLVAPPEPPPVVAAADVDHPNRYGQAALDGEIGRILAAPRPVMRCGRRVAAGGRNVALHLAAFRLGQLAADGALDTHLVWPRLAETAATVGLPAGEARRTIASGWRAGLRRPRQAARRAHRPR